MKMDSNMEFVDDRVESIVGKAENASYQFFFFFFKYLEKSFKSLACLVHLDAGFFLRVKCMSKFLKIIVIT